MTAPAAAGIPTGRVLEYPSTGGGGAAPDAGALPEFPRAAASLEAEAPGADALPPSGAPPEADRLKEQQQEELHAAEERGRKSGHAAALREAEENIQAGVDRVTGLLAALAASEQAYLRQVEREVVMLALDLAHRVLQHEAQIDRLFLRGAVRAALDAITEGGEIRVCVPERDMTEWQSFLDTLAAPGKRLTVEADPAMAAGECICKLTTGTLDLGVRAQLGEVERSFEKILRLRPEKILEHTAPPGGEVPVG